MSKGQAVARFFIISLILFSLAGVAAAEVGPKNGDTWRPAPVRPPPVDQDPLTVTDLVIDKTAPNPVEAREQAIADAPALAFQKLAERYDSKAKVPKNVSAMVQNFEIKGEQMSSTRYVAKFTVRFTDTVRNYIDVKDYMSSSASSMSSSLESSGTEESEDAEDSAGAAVKTPAGAVLVLPYYENMAGKTVLWEEPNPWRSAWQNEGAAQSKFIVPLGDINDVSAGADDAVFSGNYAVIEKLRARYRASEVVVAVANKSGSSMKVDIYAYRDGRLKERGSIAPYAGEMTEAEAFRAALEDTLRYLEEGPRTRKPPKTAETISREVAEEQETTVIDGSSGMPPEERQPILKPRSEIVWQDPAPVAPIARPALSYAPVSAMPPSAGRARLQAAAYFPNFKSWVEIQRRLGSLGPAVAVDVRALNSNRAEVTLDYDGSSLGTLRSVLASQGILLSGQGGRYALSLGN
jgi:hypothetical protein